MQKWYYLVKGQKQGPVEAEYLYSLKSAGVIRDDTPIRPEYTGEWVEFKNSDLAASATPCQTINAIGRLDRVYRDLRIGLLFSFLFMLPVAIRIIVDAVRGSSTSGRVGYEMVRFTVESPFWLILVVLCGLSLLYTLLLWGLMIYRMWSVIPREQRRINAALAAILSTVPLISAVANFWTVGGLSRALTQQERKEGVVAQRPSRSMTISFCVISLLTQGMMSLLFPVLLVLFLSWAGVARQLHDAAVNILHQRLQE